MDRYVVIPKCAFQQFFSLLLDFGTVFAPVRVSAQSFAFKSVISPEEIAFEALRTILPPKKFFYPQSETVLAYQGSNVEQVIPNPKPFVLFGVHPCDLAGLAVLDKIFAAEPADANYIARRNRCLIVGLGCMPDKHCFCKSMGTDSPQNGYDLFLTDLGDRYFVQISSSAGASIITALENGSGKASIVVPSASFDIRDTSVNKQTTLVAPASEQDRSDYKEFWQKRSQSFCIGFDNTNLRSTVDLEWDNPVWEELGEKCLSCGNCTPVCPTCYCFDLVDIAKLNGDGGERKREWDSCQFSGFAAVNGGFNFRPGPIDRLKFWYRHKLHGFDDPYGLPTCVGCGRCTVSCPAEIDDIVGVVLRLQEKKENANESP